MHSQQESSLAAYELCPACVCLLTISKLPNENFYMVYLSARFFLFTILLLWLHFRITLLNAQAQL